MALPVENRNEDTIAAAATAMSEAGIGIIRVSGPEAISICGRLYRNAKGEPTLAEFKANTIRFGYIVDPADQTAVDEVMVSVMKSPHSYTTEDTVEINAHGGTFVMDRILRLVLRYGARLAEPGEFTKRAYLGGRIDLARAEAVMDLISSQSEFARRTAMDQLQGNLSAQIREMRAVILHETAFIEAALDDPDNYSTEGYPSALDVKLSGLTDRIEHILAGADDSRRLRDGIRTAIIGRPNVGKSSLLNYLSGSDRAIVTDVAGTTRDTLEETVRLGDLALLLTDTAGMRNTDDSVEKIGVERARKAAENADLLFCLVDLSVPLTDEDGEIASFMSELLNRNDAGPEKMRRYGIVLLNKCDLPSAVATESVRELFTSAGCDPELPFITVSITEGTGLDKIGQKVRSLFHAGVLTEKNEIHLTSLRHKLALEEAEVSLKLVRKSIRDGMSEDLYTIDLMNAYSALGKILGEQVEDDLAEEVFSSFCMGK